jgi:hypothetical protein
MAPPRTLLPLLVVCAGLGTDGLILGDTVGRTPGAFGFIVSCDITGYVGASETVVDGMLVVWRSGSRGMSPFSPSWNPPRGTSMCGLERGTG